MAGKVINYASNGFPGTLSRSIDDIIESIVNSDTNPIAFGSPVALVSGAVKNVSADNTDIVGIALRTIKTEETYAVGDAKYNSHDMVDVLKRGTVSVSVPTGTPAAGGTVYIVKATGAIRTTADSTNTIQMSNWKFKGGKDANNVAEIVLTERAY